MGAIAIPPVADWSIKGDRNIGCWLCQHFQRYDDSETPADCAGECRKESPLANNHTLELVSPTDWPTDGYFTYIPNGNVGWCNGFQASLEEDIPPSPGASYQDCANTDPTAWTRPDDVRNSNMFNKKAIEDSCWYCDHFQRRYVDPGSVTADVGCGGYCQHRPQYDYSAADGGLPPGPPQDIFLRIFPLFSRIPYAPLTWCSRWERATQEVPPVPTVGDTPCFEPA